MKNGNIYTERLRGTDTVMLESDDNYNKYGNYYQCKILHMPLHT